MIFASIPSPSQSLIEIGPLTFHYYALCIIAGVIAAVYIGNKRYVAAGGSPGVVSDVAVLAVPAGVIGGRQTVVSEWYAGEYCHQCATCGNWYYYQIFEHNHNDYCEDCYNEVIESELAESTE